MVAVSPLPSGSAGWLESSIGEAVEALANGQPIVTVGGSADRVEGHLVMAGEYATESTVLPFARHGWGVIHAAVGAELADRLGLVALSRHRSASWRIDTSLDLRVNPSAFSVRGRAATLRALAAAGASAAGFDKTGHVPVLVSDRGGVLHHVAATEAAVDLVRVAGCSPVAAVAPVADAEGVPISCRRALSSFAHDHGYPVVAWEDVVRRRLRSDGLVERQAEARISIQFGTFDCVAWASDIDDSLHLAMLMGDLTADEPPLVRVHAECRAGDIFRSRLCGCGDSLARSFEMIAAEGRGVVVYLRGPDGTGISRVHDLFPAPSQDEHGSLECEAHDEFGFAVGAQILRDLGVRRMRLLTDGSRTFPNISDYGLEIVERVPVGVR